MESWGGYLRGPAILSVFLALSLIAVVAANAPVSIGTNITKIIGINYLDTDQWVEITNEGTGSMDLTCWALLNMENQTWLFPANFTLIAGSMVRVHAGEGNNTATDLYNSSLIWNRNGDTATLKDAIGKIVSEYKYPMKVTAPRDETKIRPHFLPNKSSIGRTSQTFRAGYELNYGAEKSSLKSNVPVNLSGHPFICHGGALNWAWTTGLVKINEI
jgi:hypothetical protein